LNLAQTLKINKMSKSKHIVGARLRGENFFEYFKNSLDKAGIVCYNALNRIKIKAVTKTVRDKTRRESVVGVNRRWHPMYLSLPSRKP